LHKEKATDIYADVIEKTLGIHIEETVEDLRARLLSLSKEEIVEEFMRDRVSCSYFIVCLRDFWPHRDIFNRHLWRRNRRTMLQMQSMMRIRIRKLIKPGKVMIRRTTVLKMALARWQHPMREIGLRNDRNPVLSRSSQFFNISQEIGFESSIATSA
jgi:hypothetical protein